MCGKELQVRQLLDTNIYIGNAKDAGSERLLRKRNIKVIFNVCNDIDTKYSFGDIVYVKWGMDDPKTGLADKNSVEAAVGVLAMAARQAAKMGGNTLIHCAAGHNRSALVAAVWLVHHKGWELKNAVAEAKVKDKKTWMIDKGFDW